MSRRLHDYIRSNTREAAGKVREIRSGKYTAASLPKDPGEMYHLPRVVRDV